jgi:hypothetical protein
MALMKLREEIVAASIALVPWLVFAVLVLTQTRHSIVFVPAVLLPCGLLAMALVTGFSTSSLDGTPVASTKFRKMALVLGLADVVVGAGWGVIQFAAVAFGA